MSAASVWEIAIESAIGKLKAPPHFVDTLRLDAYRELRITFAHAEQAARLPSIHRDPFDRMLVAQSLVEGLTLVTADTRIRQYDVATMSA